LKKGKRRRCHWVWSIRQEVEVVEEEEEEEDEKEGGGGEEA
jgi:hypothetical protein